MRLPTIDPESLTMNKVVRTFRMPQDLVNALGREANQRNLDLTALVLRVLHGYLTYFSLPEAAIAQLESDREALQMNRHQYLSHLLYHRCLAIRERGPGFDDPRCPETNRGGTPPAIEAPAQSVPQGERDQHPARPLGSAGGGTHNAVDGLTPGVGVWPSFGIKEDRPRKH